MDGAGNLYGIHSRGGTFGGGFLYKLGTSGDFSVLHNFGATGDGFGPRRSLAIDASGNLYGLTEYGGAHQLGTVFKVDASGH